MKKLSHIVLLALTLASVASIPALADTNPVPTKPPGGNVQAGSIPVLTLADTNPVPTKPPGGNMQAGSVSVA